ncbi:MAG TPA: ABC transporter permease [Thermotogota bacterium]|jgi:peptide/nickel transport system permease protein|nr:MAG: Dipeptide transport system permease protein DppC [Thermotogota bacterium ADurb.Bin062]HNW46985.1 ABC transporter permease [Thermotogota bacterium]HNY82839.1 ABC transporter permease [Thermotogota bacterium]HOD91538.1 ABC transporter permease [Thermotogota bacterium]HOF24104.1 ABC transporter permease [Thermotogota bacterium]
MKLKDLKVSISEFWQEFRKVKSGLVGLAIFGFFLALLIFEPVLAPFSETNTRWRDISYWDDNPQSAYPIWVNFFSAKKYAESTLLENPEVKEEVFGTNRMVTYTFEYDYQYDIAPADLILKVEGSGAAMMDLTFTRPDEESVLLASTNLNMADGGVNRISVDKGSKTEAYEFLGYFESRDNLRKFQRSSIKPAAILFAKAQENMLIEPEALKGKYTMQAALLLQRPSDIVRDVKLVIPGRVFGLLGTDAFKRDLFSGVLAGIKWALLIGLLTAVVSVMVGVIYGVISAYLGGWKDSLMQRIFEIFNSIPLLPVLIVMSAIFKPSIWNLILIMCIFYWTGSVKTVRSMGLQIKEETFIEATRALGASNFRIIFKHIIPLIIPYSFASMALFIPGAIVYEASISLLGLGDATIVTWGQILRDAYTGGAVINGLWWWVIPPGLMIAIMGMSFAFIGFALDKILHPKLRTR